MMASDTRPGSSCGLLLFLLLPALAIAQTNVHFVILIEENQPEAAGMFSETLKAAEPKFPSLKFEDTPIVISRENEEKTFEDVCKVVQEKGASVILDLTWTGWTRINDLAKSSGIDYVRAEITIAPFVRAMDAFISKRQGNDAALIFNSDKELDQSLYFLIGNSIIRVIVLEGLPDPKKLADMRPSPSYYVVFSSSAKMADIIKNASQGELFVKEQRWNLVFLDFGGNTFQSSLLPLPSVSLTMDPNVCCLLQDLPSNCNCPSNIDIIQSYLERVTFQIGNTLSTLLSQGKNIEPRQGDCSKNITAATPDIVTDFEKELEKINATSSAVYYLKEKYLLGFRNNLKINVISKNPIEYLGSWEPQEALVTNTTPIAPLRKFYRIGTAEGIPWSYKMKNSSGHIIVDDKGKPKWEGYCIDLLNKLAENNSLDFDYEIVEPKNGTFGIRSEDGSWDGIVGDLAMGETDIVIAPLTMTSEREEVIDFVAPYFDQSGISIVIRKPIRPKSLFRFMTVLRKEVWLSIVAALTVTGIMIWVLDKYSPYSAQNNKALYPYPCREFTLKESFWFALTSFTPQGGGEAPKALSGRTLVAAYWLFVVLMLATFTANLAAFLTVERMKTPVSSLEQLARQSRINYTVVKDSDTHQYFQNMKNAEDVLYKVWKDITLNSSTDQSKYRVWDYPIKEQYGHILNAIEQVGPVATYQEGFDKVVANENGEFAFIHDAAVIRYEVSRNCNLTEVGEMFAEQPYAIAVQQGSHLQEEISRKILDLQKDRYFETLSAKYWNSSAKGTCPNVDDSEGITLESLGGVFIATLFGLALAMITLAGEIFYYKRKKKSTIQVGGNGGGLTGIRQTGLDTGIHDPRKQITIGKVFRPSVDTTMPRVSYISVFPRNQLY